MDFSPKIGDFFGTLNIFRGAQKPFVAPQMHVEHQYCFTVGKANGYSLKFGNIFGSKYILEGDKNR